MKKFFAAVTALVLSVPLAAQTVQQSGNVTPGHVTRWISNGIVGDGGTPSNPTITGGIGVSGTGPQLCQTSALSGAANRICLTANATSAGFSLDNLNGGTGGFALTLNGVQQGLTTATLPVTSGNIACFSNTTGGILDCGVSPFSIPGSTAVKAPVQLATTGSNITLSGEQTIDGVLTSSSRVLVKDQSTASQNGIYTTGSGAWTRAADFNATGQVVQGTTVYVTQGTINFGAQFAVATANPIAIGTTPIAFNSAPSTFNPVTGLNKAIRVLQSASGTPTQDPYLTDGWSFNVIGVTDTGVDASVFSPGSQTVNGLHVNLTANGNKAIDQALVGTINVTGAPQQTDAVLNEFVGVQGIANSATNLKDGSLFGGGFSAIAGSGTTNASNITGAEINAGITVSGTGATRFSVLSLATHSLHAHNASTYNAILSISNAGGIAVPYGILFSTEYNGNVQPVATNGTVIGASTLSGDAATVGNIIDFSNYTAADYLLKFAGGNTWDGTGAINASGASSFTNAVLPLTLINNTTGLGLRLFTSGGGIEPLANFFVGGIPSVNDGLGSIVWNAEDGSTSTVEYAFQDVVATNVTSGSATGTMRWGTAVNNSTAVQMSLTSKQLSVASTSFGLSGNISAAAWTTGGVRYKNAAVTLTDTTSSGTVATAYTDLWGGNTIAASAVATFTNYYGSYFKAPIAGTNVTLTHTYALGADSINATAISINGTAVIAGAPALGNITGFGTGVATALGNSVNGSGGVATSAVTTLSSLASIGTITTGIWNAGAVTSSGSVVATGTTSVMSVAPSAADSEFFLKAASNTYNATFWFQQGSSFPWRLRSATSLLFSLYDAVAGQSIFSVANNASDAFHVDATGGLAITAITSTATTSAVCINTTTKVLSYDGTVGTCTVSDGRLKTNEVPIKGALDKLLRIKGIYFDWKNPKAYGTGRQIGVIAQNVEQVFPELVSTDSRGYKSADYQRLTAPIIEAIRELNRKTDRLKQEVSRLRHR